MRTVLAGVAILISSALVHAQDASPAFEVASIKPSLTAAGGNNIAVSQGILTMRNVTLNLCIKWAYSVQDSQIVGADLSNTERYDIVAKTAGGVTNETNEVDASIVDGRTVQINTAPRAQRAKYI